MVFKSSKVWTMSTDALITHLETLAAPDQIYWDARELKKTGQKFQSLDWSHFPKPVKVDGEWQFAAPEPVAAPAPAPAPAAPVQAAAPLRSLAPKASLPPPPAKIVDDEVVRAALLECADAAAAWVAAGFPHPAPDALCAAKAKAGCGWKQIERVSATIQA